MPRITKRFVDALVPNVGTRIEWDDQLKGFGVRITATGVRSYVLRYRNVAGRDRTHTIGRHGVYSPDQARDEARRLLVEVRGGSDPVGERKAMRDGATVGELLDRYLADHVRVRNAVSTATEVSRLVEARIRPALGRHKITDVRRSDVERFHASMRETPRSANLAVAVLSKALALAEDWGLRPEHSNPCLRVVRYPEKHRERFLSAAELALLGEALQEAVSVGLPWSVDSEQTPSKHLARPENRRALVNPDAVALVRLLLLSGARLSEALTLRWSDVDLKAATVALPGKKGGARVAHPVSAAALAVIAGQPRREGSPWVFPSPTDSASPLSKSLVENSWQRIRARAGLSDVRLHDLRHTVGTAAGRAGANAFLVRDLLRHSNVSMTHRYVNRDADPIRQLSDRLGEELSAALSGTAAEIIPLPVSARRGSVRRSRERP